MNIYIQPYLENTPGNHPVINARNAVILIHSLITWTVTLEK